MILILARGVGEIVDKSNFYKKIPLLSNSDGEVLPVQIDLLFYEIAKKWSNC